MCGIAVAIDWGGAEASVRRLIAGILHRGDVTDPLVAIGSGTAMCTRRLRIVDPAHGEQPQASFDGRFLVSFNGEIYNHVALRQRLESIGISFKTACDTEVIANVISAWGPAGIRELAGMYAFVAVDTATGEFLAARDPFGVKPLYFIRSGGGFLFCSEIRPLLDATESGDVRFVPPGHMMTRVSCELHYELPTPVALGPGSPRELDRILSEAVSRRIPHGLPIASLLSGGMDSTLVVHYGRQFAPAMPGYVVVGGDSPDLAFARHYADQTGLDLREVHVDVEARAILPQIETAVRTVEAFEPAIIRHSIYNYAAAKRIHQDGFRVALCGEGADELFAGYEPLEQAFTQGSELGGFVQTQCLAMMHRANLQRVDRCAMRFEIEMREPFLDQAVVTYARQLDRSALIGKRDNPLVGKAALRAIYDLYPDRLPSVIRDRKKLLFDEGAGGASVWPDVFESIMSDADFLDGQHEFAGYGLETKEELFLLRTLASSMAVDRVPHLRRRLHLVTSPMLELES
jgi:asparagine synthase (glutamine-hydrolysing)